MENISVELRALRTAHRKTLSELAEQTGLSISFLSDIERGRTQPSLDSLSKIAAAYGMKMRIEFVWRTENGHDEAY